MRVTFHFDFMKNCTFLARSNFRIGISRRNFTDLCDLNVHVTKQVLAMFRSGHLRRPSMTPPCLHSLVCGERERTLFIATR